MTAPAKRERGPGDRARAKGAARLAAIQALYQMELTGTDANIVTEEFIRHRLGGEGEDETRVAANEALFRDLLLASVRRQVEIDNLINGALATDWTLARLDSTLRALLRAATAELLTRPDTPHRVIINEYVELAHDFFGGEEPGFVNGILDRLARELRPESA